MYDFFNKAIAVAKGKSNDSSFIYIKSAVIKNHNLVRRYVLTSSMAVAPNHLIPKILLSLGLNINTSSEDLIYSVKDRTMQVASAFNLTSYTSFGLPLYNTFLDGGAEYILVTNDDFDTNIPWENLSPFTFLYHTHTNVDCKLGAFGDQSAMGFLKLNLPMLAYQYSKWKEWVRAYDAVDIENIYQFCIKYPLFNCLESYLDISCFNRIYYRTVERTIPKDLPYGATVPTLNVTPQLDRSANNIISFLYNRSMTIGQALYTVPVFFEDSALDLVYGKLDLFNTRQTDWFDMIYQLPFIHFGLEAANKSGKTLDTHLISKLNYELKAFLNTKGLDKLPRQQYQHIIDNIFDPLLKLTTLLL